MNTAELIDRQIAQQIEGSAKILVVFQNRANRYNEVLPKYFDITLTNQTEFDGGCERSLFISVRGHDKIINRALFDELLSLQTEDPEQDIDAYDIYAANPYSGIIFWSKSHDDFFNKYWNNL